MRKIFLLHVVIALMVLAKGVMSETKKGKGACRGQGWNDGEWPIIKGEATHEQCSQFCKSVTGCTAFDITRKKREYHCSLFGHRDVQPDIKIPGECHILNGCSIEKGVAYTGNNIGKGKRVSNEGACAKMCYSNAKCHYWTYYKGKTCFMKSKLGKRRERADRVSGNKHCGEGDPCDGKTCGEMCIIGAHTAGQCDVSGECSFDYNNLGCDNPCDEKTCGDKCLINGDQAGWCDKSGECSFVYGNLGCEGIPTLPPPILCPTDVFVCPDGSVVNRDYWNECEFPSCPVGCSIEKGVDYKGNNIGKEKKVSNAGACAKMCYSNDRCHYWTYREGKSCSMKSKLGKRRKRANRVSGNKLCGEGTDGSQ